MRQIIHILRITPLDTAIWRVYTSRMNTLNIEAPRKTQASIANPNLQFNMRSWNTCICAHAKLANGWENRDSEAVARYLGISPALFYPVDSPSDNADRNFAIARIQALIDDAQPATKPAPQPEPEPELVCA